jgi:hypothetical protein
VTRTWVDVPVSALAALLERERVGQLHLALRPEALWLSDEDKAAAAKQINEALAEAGLVDRGGRTVVDFLDWLPLLTTASLKYYGWMTSGAQTIGVLAATRGLQGVVAVRAGDWIRVQAADRHRLAEALVDQLPHAGPGGGLPALSACATWPLPDGADVVNVRSIGISPTSCRSSNARSAAAVSFTPDGVTKSAATPAWNSRCTTPTPTGAAT